VPSTWWAPLLAPRVAPRLGARKEGTCRKDPRRSRDDGTRALPLPLPSPPLLP
jgi:hypothetical protein